MKRQCDSLVRLLVLFSLLLKAARSDCPPPCECQHGETFTCLDPEGSILWTPASHDADIRCGNTELKHDFSPIRLNLSNAREPPANDALAAFALVGCSLPNTLASVLERATKDIISLTINGMQGEPRAEPKSNISTVTYLERLVAGLPNLSVLEVRRVAGGLLPALPPRALAAARLRELVLIDTHIAHISTEAFHGLQYLEKIYFGEGKESILFESRALGALSSLEVITVANTSLEPLPGDLLEGSTALAQVTITGTDLEYLPEGLFATQQGLKLLDLSENVIKELDDGIFWPLVSLTVINLDGNQIEQFSSELFNGLDKLRSLSANSNRLKHIAARLQDLPSLETVSLTNNLLTFSDGSPFERTGLKELRLDGNRITKLSLGGSLYKMKFLGLSRNNITKLTKTDIDPIYPGTVVDYRHNQITTVDVIRLTWRELSVPENSISLLLDHNPLVCDCDLFAFAKRVQTKHFIPEINFEADYVQCAAPPGLAGKYIRDLSLPSLSCPVGAAACPASCTCHIRPAIHSVILDCDAEPTSLPKPQDVSNEYLLSWTRLRLKSIPSQTLPPHVNVLKLPGLSLTTPPSASLLLDVRVLDLSNNSLTEAPMELLSANTSLRLYLAGNPFICDCFHADGVRALQEHATRVIDADNITCSSGESLVHVPAAELCGLRRTFIIGGTLAIIGLIFGIAIGVAYRYNIELKVFLFSRGWCQSWIEEKDLDDGAEYDAFVSFAQEDAQWVADQLVPKLEGEHNNFRLCVHYRDWVVGEMIPAQIATSVERSRRTIVVLTEHFLKSTWASLEFRAANVRAQRDRRARVLVVVLGEVPACDEMDAELRAYLSTNTYLKWGDPWFWEKLKYAMPHRRQIIAKEVCLSAETEDENKNG